MWNKHSSYALFIGALIAESIFSVGLAYGDQLGVPLSTPAPFREAFVSGVKTLKFKLPNNTEIDLSVDLKSVFESATTRKSNLKPSDDIYRDDCGEHWELRAALSTVDMDVIGTDIHFGYSLQSGANMPSKNDISASAGVHVNLIGMDFALVRCQSNPNIFPSKDRCIQVAAVRKSQNLPGVSLQFNVDFAQIKTGANFFWNTPFGASIVTIIEAGITDLVKQAGLLPILTWRSTVLDYSIQEGLWFDAGLDQGIAPNQTFQVLAVDPSKGVCRAFKPIGYLHTDSMVTNTSSHAVLDQFMDWGDHRQIEPGDVVLIHPAPPVASPNGAPRLR